MLGHAACRELCPVAFTGVTPDIHDYTREPIALKDACAAERIIHMHGASLTVRVVCLAYGAGEVPRLTVRVRCLE